MKTHSKDQPNKAKLFKQYCEVLSHTHDPSIRFLDFLVNQHLDKFKDDPFVTNVEMIWMMYTFSNLKYNILKNCKKNMVHMKIFPKGKVMDGVVTMYCHKELKGRLSEQDKREVDIMFKTAMYILPTAKELKPLIEKNKAIHKYLSKNIHLLPMVNQNQKLKFFASENLILAEDLYTITRNRIIEDHNVEMEKIMRWQRNKRLFGLNMFDSDDSFLGTLEPNYLFVFECGAYLAVYNACMIEFGDNFHFTVGTLPTVL